MPVPPDYTYTMAQNADIYQSRPYYNDEYSNGKYDRIIELKEKRKQLETMLRDYYRRYKMYNEYMKSRSGDWNDFLGRNDMGGLGMAPGDKSGTTGWYFLGNPSTVEDCKRAALRDDKMFTRIVHYTPENGYDSKGAWKYGCYGSVPGAKTSRNPRFNAIGVTTADRTYWVDEPVASVDRESVLPPTGTTNPVNYNGWVFLGTYPDSGKDSTNEYGLYGCKELAKDPSGSIVIKKAGGATATMVNAAIYAKSDAFNTVLYLDKDFPTSSLRGTCYGRKGAPVNSNTIFLYKANTEKIDKASIAEGGIIWNSQRQSTATAIYVSKTDLQYKTISSADLQYISEGGKITIQDTQKASNYQTWTIQGAPVYNPDGYIEIGVTSTQDANYKFWSVLNNSNVVVTISSDVAGATASYQSRCTDNVGGDTDGNNESGNSGPPILKSQMAKDVRERYEAILKLKSEIDQTFQTIPAIGDEMNVMLDQAIFEMQTKWEPEAWYYRDKVTKLESDNNLLDDSDSHVVLESARYVYVLYAIYAALFICGIVYIAKADDANAPFVKYVQYALFGSVIIWIWYHVADYKMNK